MYPIGVSPGDLLYDGFNIWALSGGSTTTSLTKVRASDGAVIGTFVLPTANTQDMTFDGQYVWVGGYAGLVKVRASDGAIVGTFASANEVTGVAFDGQYIWAAQRGAGIHQVLKVTTDGSVVGTFAVDSNPGAVRFDGANIWVGSYDYYSVSKLAANGSLLATYSLAAYGGGGPWKLCFDGSNMWVVMNVSVVKLRASDGAVLANVPASTNTYTCAFDGANVWTVVPNAHYVMKM